MTIRQLREQLQGPRRSLDSFYGRRVMRFFSIYLTAGAARLGVHPIAVNFLSAVVGLAGAVCLAGQHWLAGILLVNGWYLLDHVDGELARLRKITYATGLFADTIVNSIVIPAFYYGLGTGLGHPRLAVAAAYGALMMFIVPYCEATVVLQRLRQGRLRVESASALSAGSSVAVSPAKRIFSVLHAFVTLPVTLPVTTLVIFALGWARPEALHAALEALLLGFAVLVNLVWPIIIAGTIAGQKIDKKYPEIRP